MNKKTNFLSKHLTPLLATRLLPIFSSLKTLKSLRSFRAFLLLFLFSATSFLLFDCACTETITQTEVVEVETEVEKLVYVTNIAQISEQIVNSQPPNGSEVPSVLDTISITFDRIIKQGSGNVIISNLNPANSTDTFSFPVSDFEISFNTANIHAGSYLTPTERYAIFFSSNAFLDKETSKPFIGISDPLDWNFTVLEQNLVTVLKVQDTLPWNNIQYANIYADIEISFNYPLTKGTGNIILTNLTDNSVEVYPVADANIVIENETTLIIKTPTDLPYRTSYGVLIEEGAILDEFGVSFTMTTDNWLSFRTTGQWVQATNDAQFDPRYGHTGCVFNNKMWMLGGRITSPTDLLSQEIWNSTDGTNWNLVGNNRITNQNDEVILPHFYQADLISNDGKMWLVGGTGTYSISDISDARNTPTSEILYFTFNGADWDQVAFGNAAYVFYSYRSTVNIFKNKFVRVGGEPVGNPLHNTISIWDSDIDDNRNLLTMDLPFSKQRHSSVVFDDKLWITGGNDGSDAGNPIIYFTEDLTNWSITPTFFDFISHDSVVYDNKVWVIGGPNSNPEYMSMSPNGMDWYPVFDTGEMPFPVYECPILVYDNKIWVIGTSGPTDTSSKSDVWYYEM